MEFSLSFAFPFVSIWIVIFSTLWGLVGHRWKLQPLRPLFWAIALAALATANWVYFDLQIEGLKHQAESSKLPETVKALADLKIGLGYAQKFIELFVIPFVTSLIVLAMTFHLDVKHQTYVLNRKSLEGQLVSATHDYKRLNNEFNNLLELPTSDVVGKLLPAKKRADAAWRIMADLQDDLIDLKS